MSKLLALIITVVFLVGCSNSFNKEKWIENQNSDSDNPRFDMTEDLKTNYLISGKRKNEILQLLGVPHSIDSTKNGYTLYYPIGSNPGFNIDPYTLIIEFNLFEQLTSYEIVKH